MRGGWRRRTTGEGSKALLSYNFSKGPELSNPLDPGSEPTGNTRYVLDEIYESPDGIADHWQQAQASWDDFGALVEAIAGSSPQSLHAGEIAVAHDCLGRRDGYVWTVRFSREVRGRSDGSCTHPFLGSRDRPHRLLALPHPTHGQIPSWRRSRRCKRAHPPAFCGWGDGSLVGGRWGESSGIAVRRPRCG